MSDDDDYRDRLHAFMQELGPADIDRPAVLVGWACVQEWMDDQGERWISRGWADQITKWHANGLLHEALFGKWNDDEGADDG